MWALTHNGSGRVKCAENTRILCDVDDTTDADQREPHESDYIQIKDEISLNQMIMAYWGQM